MNRRAELAPMLDEVRNATAALTRAARAGDPDEVAASVELRAEAMARLGERLDGNAAPELQALRAELSAELEAGLVEARDALAQMRDAAKGALDAIKESRAVRGYSGGGASRKSCALDRAG